MDFKCWIKKQENEDDAAYAKYHEREKDKPGYIPKENFICDGVICKEEYKESKIKVLFVAKEGNEYKQDEIINKKCEADKFWAEDEVRRAMSQGHVNSPFLKGIAMLNHALLHEEMSAGELSKHKRDKDVALLTNCALINLNKRGGYSYCVWGTLEGYVKTYKVFIKEQIREINADYIVCCGQGVYNLVETYGLVDDENKEKIKIAYHPSYPFVSDIDKINKLFGKKLTQEVRSPKANDSKTRIFDTNQKWDEAAESTMISEQCAIVYGEARKFINWFSIGNHVLLYSNNSGRGKGIIAAGTVSAIDLGDDNTVDESRLRLCDFTCFEKPIPITYIDKVANDGKKTNLRGTVKRRVISMPYDELINALKRYKLDVE